jgi:hypothetical protein
VGPDLAEGLTCGRTLVIDTELTDLLDCELLSIGIVSEDGREFYAERNAFDLSDGPMIARQARQGMLPPSSLVAAPTAEATIAIYRVDRLIWAVIERRRA